MSKLSVQTHTGAQMCGLFVLSTALHDQSGQCDQTDDVRDHHELIEGVGQLPDKIVGEEGAEEDKEDRDDGVDEVCLFAEEVDDIDSAEEVPAWR